MSKKMFTKSCKKKCGIIVTFIGVGIIITVIIPFWGFILVVGAGLIYLGINLIDWH